MFGFTDPFTGSKGWVARYGAGEVSQFNSAEMIAEKWNISRDDMEAFAVESHERAIRARAEGRFENEIFELNGLNFDEGPREPNWEKIRIGVEGNYPPFSKMTPDGKFEGFDIEIALAICAEIKAQCTLINQEWDGMMPALNARPASALQDLQALETLVRAGDLAVFDACADWVQRHGDPHRLDTRALSRAIDDFDTEAALAAIEALKNPQFDPDRP